MNAVLRRRFEMAVRVRDFLRVHQTDGVAEACDVGSSAEPKLNAPIRGEQFVQLRKRNRDLPLRCCGSDDQGRARRMPLRISFSLAHRWSTPTPTARTEVVPDAGCRPFVRSKFLLPPGQRA